jgi:hypothetical protein
MDSSADLSKIKDWINQRYAQVCIEVEVKQNLATMALTANTSNYTLPSVVERIEAMYVTPVGGTRGPALVETSLSDIIDRQRGTGSTNGNTVTSYAVLGVDEFVVWPTPSAADTITIYYVGLPTALTADADVPVLHEPWCSKLLFHGPASDAATFQKDAQMAQWHAAQFEEWIRRYRTHLNRKKGTTTRQFRVLGYNVSPPHDPSTYPSW